MQKAKISTFIHTLRISLKRILRGENAIAEYDDVISRLNICRSCEFKKGDNLKYMRCEACSCLIQLKIRMAASECPKNKWLSIEPS